MAIAEHAAKYRTISWRPITHLYWSQYAFKVETHYPARGFRPLPTTHVLTRRTSMLQMISLDRLRYQRVVANFRRRCDRYLPDDRTRWKSLETERSFHFYFQQRDDMLRFVAGNTRNIRTVYEPAGDNDVDQLINTRHTYLRPTLFFDAYTFRIQFRTMSYTMLEQLDEWVYAIFDGRPRDHKYNPFGRRCLYLSREDDILLTRLAFSPYILRVERVILRSKDLHACDVGQAAGGEGSDSPAHGI